MTLLTLAAAQSESIAGDLPANLTGHQRLMCLAAQQGVQLLVFPELSLTGYEPQLAAELAVAPDSPVLQPVRDLARELHMTTVVGMPIRLVDGGPVLIGALVLGADGSLAVYSKQHLHPGEERAFAAGSGGAPWHLPSTRLPWRFVQTSAMPAMCRRQRRLGPMSMLRAC